MKNRRLNQFIAIIRKDIKVFMDDFLPFLLLLVIFPICLGFFYGIMYQNIIEQTIEFKELKLYVMNEASESEMAGFLKPLESDAFPFLELQSVETEKEMADRLQEENTAGLVVTALSDPESKSRYMISYRNRGGETIEKQMVQRFLSQAVADTNLSITIQRELSNIGQGEEDENIEALQRKISRIQAGEYVEQRPVEETKALSSMQIYMISVFISFSLFFSTGIVLQREKKLVMRAYASGANRFTLFFGNAVSTFLIGFVMCCFYYTIVFGFILNLKVPVVPLLSVMALQGIMIAGFQTMLMGLCRTDKSSILISIFVLMIFLFAGGGAYPTDTVAGADTISNMIPNYNLFKLYEALILKNPLNDMMWRGLFVALISFAMAGIGLVVFLKKEEV